MKLQHIAAVAAIALVVSGCGVVEKAKQYADSQPTMTLSTGIPSIPNANDVTAAALDGVLTSQGFTPNGDKTEYTKGVAVLVVRDGVPETVRMKYREGVVECPASMMATGNYLAMIDTLGGLGYSETLKKYQGACKPK